MSNQEFAVRRQRAVPRGVASATSLTIVRARNAELWDVEGRRYIDFAAGIAVLNVGHCHPRVIAAVESQLERFTHTAFQVAAYESYIELAERLNASAPFAGPAKSILFTTGAEAVENAIKIARVATRRHGVVAFGGGFHGRSFMALALTGKTAPYKQSFGPMPSGVFHVPFPIPHAGVTTADALTALDRVFRNDIAESEVAAIVVEPIQGEGGFHPAPSDLLKALRELCDQHGILLVADEVQTGFARTGKMFAIEHSGVEPDLVVVAKALGGGLPLSGIIGRAELMDAPSPGGLGGTYGGSPLACAAALAVLDVITEENLCTRSLVLGERVRARLGEMMLDQSLRPIGHIRGTGSMIAFDLLAARGADAICADAAREVCARACERGLIVLPCGTRGEAIRLLYPLTIPEALLEEGMDLLQDSLRVA